MPHSVKEERKGVTLPDLFWSYAIYSSALFDSSWIFIDFPDFCHYTIHFDWKQKNSQLQSEDCTSCFFPSEAPQYLVFLLPLHSCLSSVLIMTPPPPPLPLCVPTGLSTHFHCNSHHIRLQWSTSLFLDWLQDLRDHRSDAAHSWH